uniref:Histone deacetylase interacting domain-containing protein n=1 Tax=Mycena chlorophos TaxID=658473 RepID=A0ABQ0MF58_MYCCL|nr:predicted protein [Mycena chlorophos]
MALNVGDALSYLDAVKKQFHEQPDIYNKFLDIMKNFKSQLIDTPGVIQRVSTLFHEHPALIQGFNTFLPTGYRIECGKDGEDSNVITVTTPSGTTTTKNGGTIQPAPPPEAPEPPPPSPSPPPAKATPSQQNNLDPKGGYDPAIQYVQKIKSRCSADVYRQFLDILSTFHNPDNPSDEAEVQQRITTLFKDQPDLAEDFASFLPDNRKLLEEEEEPPIYRSERLKQKKVEAPVASSSVVPQKRKRKNVERELVEVVPKTVAPKAKKPKPTPETSSSKARATSPSSRRQPGPRAQPPAPVLAAAPEDSQAQVFFDRVKRSLEDSRDTYNEFLKLINLFTQDFIDTARLVRESRTYIGDGELLTMLKEILGWDDRKEQEYVMEEQANGNSWVRPTLVPQNVGSRVNRAPVESRIGSYRRINAEDANVLCSGRDEMCRSVLNDEWVSHPTWGSEDAPFGTPRSNMYEEALHRSEEERHEYDFHIEAIVRTISMLEPLHNKLASLSHEDRQNYKPKPNLNGQMKAIHHRVIKKIYGREAGLQVIQALQENTHQAIPIVMQRLRQKEDEWKRAQREWNKVWREVDARNYSKSLDHQGINFKTADKKAITTKAFVTQIESAREQQISKRASLVDPLLARTRPRHQLEFVLDDTRVLHDALKLTFSFLDRSGQQVVFSERRKVENFLRAFIPLFFVIDTTTLDAAFVSSSNPETQESEMSDEAAEDADVSSTGSGPSKSKKGDDLRKKLLKSEQAKATRRTRYTVSPSVSRAASPILPEDELLRPTARVTFFTNTGFYTLLRLFELLCSRLAVFKRITQKLTTDETAPGPTDPGAFHHPDTVNAEIATQPKLFYDILLQSCEQLFDNKVEQHVFEDQMRYMFGVKEAYKIFTVDKLLGAIMKQVQALLSDNKAQELMDLLKRDRILTSPTAQDLSNSRKTAEEILGSDENLFRIDWLPEPKHLTFQLIGKDDTNFEDSEVATGRWQAYVESFVSPHLSAGVPANRVRRPYLRRNIPPAVQNKTPNIATADGLEIKICVQTYRLFYVAHSEDYLFKLRSKEEVEGISKRLKRKNELRAKWFKEHAAAS